MVRKKALASKPSKDIPLRQGSGRLRFPAKDVQARYESYVTKTIFQPYVIDFEALTEFGIRDEVAALVEEPEWRYLLVDFRDDIFADLLMEVMATLQVPTQFELNSTRCIHFSVGHTDFHFSLNDLSRLMGIDDLQALSEEDKNQRHLDVPDAQAFWKELTGGKTSYNSSSSKSTQLKKELKFVQYVLARSICGRQESSGNVQTVDLLCLFGMVKKQKIHLGCVLGYLLQKQHNVNVRSIFLGPYVTRLVRSTQQALIRDIREPKAGGMTLINKTILQWIFPTKKGDKRARTAEEVQDEDVVGGDEGPSGAGAGEGSSGGSFQQQVLAQLAAMQAQFGQLYTKVDNIETTVGRLETSVGEVQTEVRDSREESRAYYDWLRGRFPPPGGPQYPFDPSHPM